MSQKRIVEVFSAGFSLRRNHRTREPPGVRIV